MSSASLAATKASGYPAAFEAKAEDQEQWAFTSVTQMSDSVCKAYLMLHSPTTPKCLMWVFQNAT